MACGELKKKKEKKRIHVTIGRVIFARWGQWPLKHYDYLDGLGGVGEAYAVYSALGRSRSQDLCTVSETKRLPLGYTGDIWGGGTKHALFTDGNLMGFAHKSRTYMRVLTLVFRSLAVSAVHVRSLHLRLRYLISYRNICSILRINCKSLAHRLPHSRLQLGFYNILASFCLHWEEKKKTHMTSTYS